MNGDGDFLPVGQAQVALFQPLGHPGNLGQGEGDSLFQIGRQEENTGDDDGNAYQGGPDYRHENLVVGVGGGNAGEEQPVNRAGGVPGGNVGTDVLFV